VSAAGPSRERFRLSFLLLLTLGITGLFLVMIRQFLMAVLLAAIFSGLAHPLYRRILRRMRGRRAWASVATILILLLGVGLPLVGFLGLVATQGLEISQAAGPWIERQVGEPGRIDALLDRVPFLGRFPALRNLLPEGDQIMARAAEAVSGTGAFIVNNLAGVTKGTLSFLLQLFVMLYAMFFFLVDGRALLNRVLYYVPLTPQDEARLVERFVSVTRATLKGALFIAMVQGLLAGAAFLLAGVPGAAFWATIMIVLSIIPAVGAGIVWIPAVIYLFIAGHTLAAFALLAWCFLVVGTVDNLLRPRLVGRDTRMPDLLVLLSTLGGILLFGAVGVVIGPIVASLFVTVWHLYGEGFADWLPGKVPPAPAVDPELKLKGLTSPAGDAEQAKA
jgi:predicted PurR-regulated permease PerM